MPIAENMDKTELINEYFTAKTCLLHLGVHISCRPPVDRQHFRTERFV